MTCQWEVSVSKGSEKVSLTEVSASILPHQAWDDMFPGSNSHTSSIPASLTRQAFGTVTTFPSLYQAVFLSETWYISTALLLSSNHGLPPLNCREGSTWEEGLRTVQPNTFTVPKPERPATPGAGGSVIKIACYRFPAPSMQLKTITLAPEAPETSSCLCRRPYAWGIHSHTKIYIKKHTHKTQTSHC